MAKRFVNRVTVTGADDSVKPEDLLDLANEFSYVEFGILLSQKKQGSPRFPSKDWTNKLYELWIGEQAILSSRLSGHICGQWVKGLCMGNPMFFREFGRRSEMFRRIQLNFHAESHSFNPDHLADVLDRYFCDPFMRQVIFQFDGVNDNAFQAARKEIEDESGLMRTAALFDLSGGTGLLPKEWPKQIPGVYCGYAGGLSPDNLQEELEKISDIAENPFWIDAETLLRSDNDAIFDLKKVRRFLKMAEPWINGFRPRK